jgi:beta-phosphoglucomutase-like phosphatase (HAD superfamily)
VLRAVVFDFDGIIADDERLHLEGFRHALAAHGISVSETDYFAKYLGYDDHDGFAAILSDAGVEPGDELITELTARKHAVFTGLVRARIRIYPGVESLLTSLRAAPEPAATAIGSGALRPEIELVLGIAGLGSRFDAIVSAEDVDHGKPHPETFLKACAALGRIRPGLRPEDCLVIEDSPAGLAAAEAAGMKRVAVTNSYPAGALEADLVVASLEEIDRIRCARLWND